MSPDQEKNTGSDRILVAMSGGVDSSVAAALLVEQGREVVGVTLNLAGDTSRCCSLEDADDARKVAETLGIRFFVANYADRFREEVIEEFADSYLRGETPIPCVACNKRFKFDYLMDRASVFGAGTVATGHYARVSKSSETGLFELRRPRDTNKDQTYFLFQLDQAQLAGTSFPLGDMSKEEVRLRATDLGLATAHKPESQEICFVPDGDYARVVEKIRPEAARLAGDLVDSSGQTLGQHKGVHRFTIGQRHGLGISSNRRLYVKEIRAKTQEVIVGDAKDLDETLAHVNQVNWISGSLPSAPVRARVQVRYRHAGVPATITPLPDQRAQLVFDEPVRAIAPGQAAVFYGLDDDMEQGERVLGGGWLSSQASS